MSPVKKLTGLSVFGKGLSTEATTIFGIVRAMLNPMGTLVEGQQPIQNVAGVRATDIVTVPLGAVGTFHAWVSGRLPGMCGGIPPVNVPHEIVTWLYGM